MKNLLAFISIAILATTQINAQEGVTPSFNKSDKVLNLGIGLGSTYYSGTYYSTTLPPVSASFEMGVADELIDGKGVIGVGGYVGYSAYKWENTYPGYGTYGYKYTNLVIGARGAFHYPLVDKLDLYTGIMLGYNIVSSSEFGDVYYGYDYSTQSSSVAWSYYVGGRYYVSNSFAVMAELGYGIAYLNLGISLKF
ncbi:MAG TPA: hypothetical protein VJ946_04385 [Bacteroidales bacterium]|nr:hypothetical protein [Bacteroidales bacterium]